MKVDLLLADEFHQLASGKIMAMGLYTDKSIILAPPLPSLVPKQPEPGVVSTNGFASLALMLVVSDVEPGPFSVKARVMLPSGQIHPAYAFNQEVEAVASEHGSVNVIMRFAPFVVLEFGMYEVTFELKGGVFSFHFSVLQGKQPSN